MSDIEPIAINDFATLFSLIEGCEFRAEWTVRCDIGPDWIGGGRSIQFHIGQRPLADTPIHDQLKEALVKALEIPENSFDAVLRGDGKVTAKLNTFEIQYEWSECVPYMDSRARGCGKTILLLPS